MPSRHRIACSALFAAPQLFTFRTYTHPALFNSRIFPFLALGIYLLRKYLDYYTDLTRPAAVLVHRWTKERHGAVPETSTGNIFLSRSLRLPLASCHVALAGTDERL
jgi:hypothetical protein